MNKRRNRRATAALVAVLFVVPAVPGSVGAAPAETRRLTPRSANGATPATSVPDVTSPQIALDGLVVAFSSDATNLVKGDTNGAADVFVENVATGKITRVSTTAGGAQANGASYSPALSGLGDSIAFVSTATNLVPGDTNGVADVFLKNLKTGAIQRVSVGPAGMQASGASNDPFVSLFGDYVTFESSADNLDTNDSNTLDDAFVRDVKRARTQRLVAPPPQEDVQLPSVLSTSHARISYDGRYAVFSSEERRNAQSPVIAQDSYVLDRSTRKVTHIIIPAWAGTTREMVAEPVISADGRYVAVTAWSVLTENDSVANQNDVGRSSKGVFSNQDGVTRNPFDFKRIWVFDRFSKRPFPVSNTGIAGAPDADGDSYDPQISADGHVITFVSDATDLVAGDTNGVTDVFARDLERRTLSRLSLGVAAAQASVASVAPSMSYEGRTIVFSTTAPLTTDDTNGANDIFLRDRGPKTVPDAAPVFSAPYKGERGVGLLDTVTVRIRARDADKDPLRYDVIANIPSGASIDPVTGVFTWKVAPNEKTGHRIVAFWTQDPSGMNDLMFLEFYVRDARQTALCDAALQCVP